MKTNEELIKELEEARKYIKQLEQEKEKISVELYETNKKLNDALLVIATYQEKYDIARTKKFIPSTEKLDSIVINEVEETLKKQQESKKNNRGKKYNKAKFDYEKYVTEIRYIYPEEKVCPECGKELVEISNKTRYVVEIIPSKIKVTKLIKVNMKCPDCNKKNNKIYYPLCNDNLTGSILSPSLAAFIAYHKYELGIPLEHLAKHITNSIGFEINKENLSNYMAKVGTILEPIYKKMKEDLLSNNSKVIHSDETTLVVTKRNEENKDRKVSYVYVYASSYYDEKQIRIYDFHESRSIDETTKWLKNYEGVVECDNYSGYNKLKSNNSKIKLQKCWAHVRRRYADILKNLSEKQKKSSKAYLILKEISKLFEDEKQYRKDRLTPSQIVEARKKNVPSIKEQIYELVYNSNPAKNSALEKAIEYTKDCWDDLYTFIDNGYVEMTNNTAERAVKPFVIQRKVFQTSGSYAGARYTGKIFSIIQTCLINNVKVEKYLEYVLNNLNKKPIEELLPYSKEIKNIK